MPFFIEYGYNPKMAPDVRKELAFPSLEDVFHYRAEAREQAQASLVMAAEHMKWYYDKNRVDPPFKVGDKVLLKGRDLRIRNSSAKLSAKNYGPYEIIAQPGPVDFHVQLPPQNKVHPVFHASKLIPYHEDEIAGRNPERPDPIEVEGHDEYEVARILDSRLYYGYVQYYVKWAGYDISEATWEPVRNVKHAKKLLDEFHALHPEAPQPIALNNPRPISREFNREIWFEVPRGSSALKRG